MRTITKNVSSLPVGADYFFKESIMELSKIDLYNIYAYHFNKVYNRFPLSHHHASEATLKAQIEFLKSIWTRGVL